MGVARGLVLLVGCLIAECGWCQQSLTERAHQAFVERGVKAARELAEAELAQRREPGVPLADLQEARAVAAHWARQGADMNRAIELLREALDAVPQGEPRPVQWVINLALSYLGTARFADLAATLDAEWPDDQALGRLPVERQVEVLYIRGALMEQTGKVEQGLAILAESRRRAEGAELPLTLRRNLILISLRLNVRAGRVQEAMTDGRAMVALLETEGASLGELADANQWLSYAASLAQNYDVAQAAADLAADQAAREPRPVLGLRARVAIARAAAYETDPPRMLELANQAYEESVATFGEGHPATQLAESYITMAMGAMEPTDRAVGAYEALIPKLVARENHVLLVFTRESYASMLMRMRRDDAAREQFELAASAFDSTGLAGNHVLRAAVYAHLGALTPGDEGLAHWRRAMTILDHHLELSSWGGDTVGRSVARRLAETWSASGWVARTPEGQRELAEMVLRVRGIVRDRQVLLRGLRAGRSGDAELQGLFARLDAAAQALAQQGDSPTPDALLALTSVETDLNAALAQRGLGAVVPAKPTLEQVEQGVGEGSVAIEYVALRARMGEPEVLHAVVVRAGQTRVVRLAPMVEVDAAVQAWRRAIDPRRAGASTPEQAGAALYEAVLRPLVGAEPPGKLLIAPDAGLGLVAWPALRTPGGKWLVETTETTLIGSLRDLLAGPLAAPSGPALALVDPDVPGGPARLSHARQEAQGLRELDARTLILADAQATPGALLGARSPSILHVASHGFFGAGSPGEAWSVDSIQPLAQSGLRLSPDARAADGRLSALDLAALDLSGTRLSVLSACMSGAGQVQGGEGLVGLRRALRLAGSRQVISALIDVPSISTAELMDRLYRRMAEGMTAGPALRSAQLDALRIPARSHPVHWAGFLVDGLP